jgi:alkylhydroperoxidase/carboxymuconolactone decarboxylase family protein YurZ
VIIHADLLGNTATLRRNRRRDLAAPRKSAHWRGIFIVGLTLLRAERRQIQDHIKVALALGISKEMILEAIELAFMGGGFIAVQHGVLAWQETVGAERVEPTVDALEAYKACGGGG